MCTTRKVPYLSIYCMLLISFLSFLSCQCLDIHADLYSNYFRFTYPLIKIQILFIIFSIKNIEVDYAQQIITPPSIEMFFRLIARRLCCFLCIVYTL